jgi:hypothetical protein
MGILLLWHSSWIVHRLPISSTLVLTYPEKNKKNYQNLNQGEIKWVK